jgi:hypothetical protein
MRWRFARGSRSGSAKLGSSGRMKSIGCRAITSGAARWALASVKSALPPGEKPKAGGCVSVGGVWPPPAGAGTGEETARNGGEAYRIRANCPATGRVCDDLADGFLCGESRRHTTSTATCGSGATIGFKEQTTRARVVVRRLTSTSCRRLAALTPTERFTSAAASVSRPRPRRRLADRLVLARFVRHGENLLPFGRAFGSSIWRGGAVSRPISSMRMSPDATILLMINAGLRTMRCSEARR